MRGLLFGRSSLSQTAVSSLLTLAAVALLGLVLAYWTWVWFAPRVEPRAQAAAVQSGSVAFTSAIFGNLQRQQNAAAPTGIAIRLLGVVAASGGRSSYGVVQLDSKQILAVHEGDDIAPGIRLAEVLADRLILQRGGVRETLAWPEKKTSVSPSPHAATSAAPQPAQPVAPQAAQPAAPRTRRSAGRRN